MAHRPDYHAVRRGDRRQPTRPDMGLDRPRRLAYSVRTVPRGRVKPGSSTRDRRHRRRTSGDVLFGGGTRGDDAGSRARCGALSGETIVRGGMAGAVHRDLSSPPKPHFPIDETCARVPTQRTLALCDRTRRTMPQQFTVIVTSDRYAAENNDFGV